MSEMNEASGDRAREELRESTLRIEGLSAQLAALQKEVDMHFPCVMTFHLMSVIYLRAMH